MYDWFIKILEYIKSVKNAFVILLTAILAIFLWKKGIDLIQSYGLTLNFAKYLFALICYCTSFIAINIIHSSYSKFNKLLASTYIYTVNKYNLSKRTTEILPHLSKNQIHLLLDMVKNDRNLPSDDRQIQHLLESNLIHKSQQTSAKTSLYKINRQVKKPLFKFIKNEQENYLDNLLIENNTSTLRFISLFYDIEIEFGTKESNQLMPHNIYILSLSLIDQHIITKKDTTNTQNKSTVVRFELDTYAEQLISKRIFHKRPARHILELNLNYVLGSGATGGGAVGNGYTF